MTLLFIVLLAIIAALLLKRQRTALLLLTFLCIHLILSGGGLFTSWMLGDLQRDSRAMPAWGKRNAIVILGFGTVKWPKSDLVTSASFAYPRLMEGLRLYKSCSGECKILVTGGDPMGNGETEGDVMARELIGAGAKTADLIVENKSRNTFQNARNSAPLLEGYDRIYLVTSGVHMRRAKLFFNHFVGEVQPAPADHMRALKVFIPISPNLIYFDFAMHEYLGILQYRIYNWMGWNPPPKRPPREDEAI